MTIGEKIKKIREDKNLSLRDFAKKLGVSHPIVSRWEDNLTVPNAKYVAKMSKVFGVSSDWLLNDWGDMFFDEKVTKSYVDGIEKNLSDLKDEILEIYRNENKTSSQAGFRA